MFHEGLQRPGIQNITMLSNGLFGYRFFPMGDDHPLHQRVEFTKCEQAYIDTFLPDCWDTELRTLPTLSPPPVTSFSVPSERLPASSPHNGQVPVQNFTVVNTMNELDSRMLRARKHILRTIQLMEIDLEDNADRRLLELMDMYDSALDSVVDPLLGLAEAAAQRRRKFDERHGRF